MANQLKKATLKVLSFNFICGKTALEELKVNSKRRYPFTSPIAYSIVTNQGTLNVELQPGFEFDGRSGPWIIDWYAPNLGSFSERLCWLTHDANAYALDLNFSDTNVLLYAMLRDLAKYKKEKAATIQLAVSITRGWYGTPKGNDWCCKNIGKVSTVWLPCQV